MVKNIFGIFSSKTAVEDEKEYIEEESSQIKDLGLDKETEKKAEALSEEDAYYAKDKLQEILDKMGIMSVVKVVSNNSEGLVLDIKSDEIGRIIGKSGSTLDSLQFIMRQVIQRKTSKRFHMTLDANDYRNRRKQTLIKKANKYAKMALDQDREVKLGPMPAFERRIIHLALEHNNSVETFSKGERDKRQVVIAPIVNA